MSKYEKEITVYRNGEETPVAMKIKPEEFTDPELVKLTARRIFIPGNRQCISVMATRRVIYTEKYIRDVTNLEPDARIKHIVDTAISMSKATSFFIQEKGTR